MLTFPLNFPILRLKVHYGSYQTHENRFWKS